MNQFFKYFFASILGTIAAFVLLFFLLFLIGTISVASSIGGKKTTVRSNTVLELDLTNFVPEHTNNIGFNSFNFEETNVVGVHDLVKLIAHAKTDDKIKGIYLNSSVANTGGLAKANAIRDALLDFKESGKFIVAYSKIYSQNAYYLASTADQIYLNPMGIVDFRGYGGTLSFYTNMLEKVGVDMNVFYAGDYKGATEIYRLTKLSPENRSQIREYVDDSYQSLLSDLSETRNISTDSLHIIANNYYGGSAEDALASGLVDILGFEDQVVDFMRTKMDLKEGKKVRRIDVNKYFAAVSLDESNDSDNTIAVVYAEGAVVDGEGENGMIADQPYIEVAEKLRKSSKVKAVVLRVNSPGGSAMASENILHSYLELKKAGKPIIVSMGDVAASGGYYIAMAGDAVFAEENTITGSIGVYRLRPSTQELLEDKMGITHDTIQTGQFSTAFNLSTAPSAAEAQYLQKETERTYQTFLKRVADGRNMPVEEVHKVAQGRVWTAERAKENGLVDEIGGLEDAIALAAEKAGLSDYEIKEYPKVKDPITQLLEELLEGNFAKEQFIKSELGSYYNYYKQLKTLQEQTGVQARMPFSFEIK